MIKQTIFLFVITIMIIYGLVFTLKYFGWPSIAERENRFIRSLKTGLSSTILVIGLMLIYSYSSSAETFWSQWTIRTFIGAVLFFVIPIFGILTAGSFVQFSVLEKTQSIMSERLRKIVSDSTKDDKKPK